MTGIRYIADNEDGVSWFGRNGVSRRAARAEFASLVGRRPWPWRFVVTAEFMRPADITDCPASTHDVDLDETCRCYELEEGSFFVCAPAHPKAIAVWRVEGRFAPAWIWRLRHRRARLYRALRRERAAVLWGGAVERHVTRLDRLIAGPGIAFVLHASHQLRLNETRWRWCDVCWRETPQREHLCLADEHFDRAGARREVRR